MALTVRNETDLHRAAMLFGVLAHQTRLAICLELAEEERKVTELVENLRLAQSTVSGNLARLREGGLVVGRQEGRQVVYSLAHRELLGLFADARGILGLVYPADPPMPEPDGRRI